MSPRSRRALLATVATGSAGALAGCTALAPAPSDEPRSAPGGLDGRSVYAPDVTLPDAGEFSTVDDPAAADVVALPAGEASVAPAIDALGADTPVAAVGEDAQATLMRACEADGRSHGFASDAWGPDTRVVAAAPFRDHLVTHRFVGVDPPADLPWVLGEVLSPAAADPTLASAPSVVPDGVADRAELVGASRTLGRNGVAGFDRWDRVRTASDADWAAVVVDIEATILAGSEVAGGDGRYRADGVRLAAEFDERLNGIAPPSLSDAGLRVRNTSDRGANAAEHEFEPTTAATRRSFTARQRSYVTADETPRPLSYVANARFRWRDPRLLEDDRHHHHTPGRAVWDP